MPSTARYKVQDARYKVYPLNPTASHGEPGQGGRPCISIWVVGREGASCIQKCPYPGWMRRFYFLPHSKLRPCGSLLK
jgi:hypothetical protein